MKQIRLGAIARPADSMVNECPGTLTGTLSQQA
jgi:hypothetical protein